VAKDCRDISLIDSNACHIMLITVYLLFGDGRMVLFDRKRGHCDRESWFDDLGKQSMSSAAATDDELETTLFKKCFFVIKRKSLQTYNNNA